MNPRIANGLSSLKIRSTSLFRYRLPLARAILVSGKSFQIREGLVVCLRSEEGLEGWGEIAPLPGLSWESLAEATKQAEILARTLSGKVLSGLDTGGISFLEDGFWSELFSGKSLATSVRIGFEMALVSLCAGCSNAGIADWLGAHLAKIERVDPVVKTSCLLEAGSPDFLETSERYFENGFRTFKIKIARLDQENERGAISELVNRFPDVRLRLDANACLGEKQFEVWLEDGKNWHVEYWEEPFSSHAALEAWILRNASLGSSPVFALDETLREKVFSKKHTDWEEALSSFPKNCRVCIVKPTLLGSLKKIFYFSQMLERSGRKIVLSSSFESGVGLFFWAALTSVLGGPAKDLAAGLGTRDYFSCDLLVEGKSGTRFKFDLRQKPFRKSDLDFKQLELLKE